ncbi:MAG: hypothetical protein OEM47_04545 [Deltaproteobacteria bacterium]|nr:hypothetical protein [Deltaproteobacteria bacterium]
MRNRHFYFLCIVLLSAALAPGCVKRQTTAGVVDWERNIATMIVKAEQLGAQECSPRELARAKVLLELAIHEREERYYPLSWTTPSLVKAEQIAHEILANRERNAHKRPENRMMAFQSGPPAFCYD